VFGLVRTRAGVNQCVGWDQPALPFGPTRDRYSNPQKVAERLHAVCQAAASMSFLVYDPRGKKQSLVLSVIPPRVQRGCDLLPVLTTRSLIQLVLFKKCGTSARRLGKSLPRKLAGTILSSLFLLFEKKKVVTVYFLPFQMFF